MWCVRLKKKDVNLGFNLQNSWLQKGQQSADTAVNGISSLSNNLASGLGNMPTQLPTMPTTSLYNDFGMRPAPYFSFLPIIFARCGHAQQAPPCSPWASCMDQIANNAVRDAGRSFTNLWAGEYRRTVQSLCLHTCCLGCLRSGR